MKASRILAAAAAAFALRAGSTTVWPDYLGIAVPRNIAPLNFKYDDFPEGAEFSTTAESSDGSVSVTVRGADVSWPADEWRRLLEKSAGGTFTITLSGKTNGVMLAGFPLVATNTVPPDGIDPYLTYRLIPPSYTGFSEMGIYQRNLESFDERPVYRNVQTDPSQCVNCHTFNRADPGQYLFHARATLPGTIVVSRKYGKKKVDLKAKGLIGAGVYPAWHPSGDYIAFSLNETRQSFFTANTEKIEVMDLQSDLVLYSLADDTITVVEDAPEIFECFPSWSPDGTALFTVRASTGITVPPDDQAARGEAVFNGATNIFYDLAVRTFDAKTRKFSPPEILFDAKSAHRSITHPRVSPDGRWLVATIASHGVFHIWHRDADLLMFDFEKKAIRPLFELNSPDTESYHTFSSTGKWMVFSSRRDDGAYTRPYFTCFDSKSGVFSKPFLLPARRPDDHLHRMYSYNVPEFATGPVAESAVDIHELVKRIPVRAKIAK